MVDKTARHIPNPLRRRVMVEAGHRCAVPTCRGTSALEVHHITDWAIVQEHSFENLICLCAVCHHRATTGEIDRLSILQYKANLGVLSNRYGDYERRILEVFTLSEQDPTVKAILSLPGGRDLDLWYLIKDGLLEKVPQEEMFRASGGGIVISGIPSKEGYRLTELGVAFVLKLKAAESVE